MLTIQPSKSSPIYVSKGNANVCPHNHLYKNFYQFSYFQTENYPSVPKQGIVNLMLVYLNNVHSYKNEQTTDRYNNMDRFFFLTNAEQKNPGIKNIC